MMFLDIIDEILETDRIADEKLDMAQSEKLEILKQSEIEISEMKKKSEEQLARYRSKKHAETQAKTDEKVGAIKSAAEKKKKEFDKLYWENHRQWETEIFERIWAD